MIHRSLTKIVIASHNQGKIKEITNFLNPLGIQIITSAMIHLDEPEETADTFKGNAILKATITAKAANLPALADDSGLVIHALNGLPGVHGSAGWATLADGSRDFSMAMRRVENALSDHTDRRAYFISVLALVWPDGHTQTFEGRVDGQLTFPPRGTNGFGYDPIFIPQNQTRTFGEMDPSEKKVLSHRAKAIKLFLTRFTQCQQ